MTTQRQDALVALIEKVADGLEKRIDSFEKNVGERLTAQDLQIARTLEQATKTNGRMNAAEVKIATLEADTIRMDRMSEAEVEIAALKAGAITAERIEVRRVESFRHRLSTVVFALGAGAGITEAAHALGLF